MFHPSLMQKLSHPILALAVHKNLPRPIMYQNGRGRITVCSLKATYKAYACRSLKLVVQIVGIVMNVGHGTP